MPIQSLPLRRLQRLALAFSAATLLAPLTLHATTYYWDGGSADIVTPGDAASQGGAGIWNTALLNWDVAPSGSPHTAWGNATSDEAVFAGAAATVSLGSAVTANLLTFNVSGYTIDNGGNAANTITLAGTAPGITVTNAADADVVSAIIAGTVGLTKAGAGALVLSGVNTYTGATTISGGTLSIGADLNLGAAPGAATAGYLNLNGGTLATTATFTLSTNRGIALGVGGGTISVGLGFTTTYGGIIAGGNALTKAGTGTLVLSGTNTFNGGLAVNAGVLSVSAVGNLGTGAISLNGGTLRTSEAAQITFAAGNVITVGASGGTIDNTVAFKLLISTAGGLTGSGTLTRTASANNAIVGTTNVLQISVANTGFTGAVVLNGGQNEISANGFGNGLTPGNTITVNSGAELTANNSTLPNALILNTGANIGGDAGTSTFSGAITANGAFNVRLGDFFQSTQRNLIISGGITSAGAGAGAITFLSANSNSVGSGLGQTLFLNGDNSAYSANIAVPAGFNLSFGTLNSRGTGTLTVTSSATALGGIGLGYVPATQSDLPALTTNSTGANGGVFEINTTGFSGALDMGTLYGTSTSPTGGTNGVWYLGSGGTGSYTAATLAASNGTYRLGGGFGTLTIANAVLTGAANVVIGSTAIGTNGTGTIVLAGANDYTGTTTVNAGSTLSISNGSALGATATGTTLNAGGSLALSGGIIVNEPLTVTGNSATASATNIVNGIVNISGTNTLAGQINAATSSANFRISTTAGTLNLTGPIILSGGGTATGLVFAGAGTISQTNTISGGGSLFSTSTGTSTLSATNTFTGKVQIQQGTFSTPSINSVVSSTASSGLGAPIVAANGVIELGNSTTTGGLTYTGTGETSDRVLALIGTTGGGTLTQSGTGLLKFTSNLTATGAGIKTLTLQGSTAGAGELSGVIPNNSAANLTNVTKTGSGTWTLSALNTYTGTTLINQGTLVINTLTAVSGAASSLGSPTTVATGTIGLGSGSTTPLAGTLQYIGTGSTSDRVINLASTTGGGTLDQSGGGTFQIGAVSATGAGTKTLTLTGSTSGVGVVGGAIANNSGTNLTNVAKTGTGTWTLAGPNTYTGTTIVNGGLLRVNGNSSAATGAVTVNAGGYLGGTGTIGGAVTVATNGGVDLRDGSVGTLLLASTLTLNGTVAAPNTVTFDLGASTVDVIAATGAVSASTAGGALITFNQLAGSPLANGTYTLITSGATSVPTGFALATTQSGGHTYALTTNTSGNIVQVTVGAAATGPAAAVWGGTASTAWTAAGNWYTDASSTLTGAIPGVGTNVSFYTTTPAATNLSTTLGADFEINSLTFLSTATTAVTIAGAANALTIDAGTVNGNASGNGISQLAAQTHTISSRVGIAAAQTWTVASGGGLTISGLVFDTGAGFTLTKAGAGTLTLSGTSNTFTGDINVTAGALAFVGNAGGNGDPLSLGAGTKTITVTNNAVLRPTSSLNPTSTNTKRFVVGTGGATFDPQTGVTFTLDDAGQFSGTGDLTVTSSSATPSGVVSLNNQAYNFSGNVIVNSGTLRLGAGSVLGTTTGRTITVASGAVLDVISTTANVPLNVTLNGTGISNGGALIASSAAGTLATSAITLASNSSIGGASTLTLGGPIGGAFNLTKIGVGLTLLSGTNTYGAGSGVTTTISAGILQATKTASLPNYSVAGQVIAASGSTLALNVGGAGEFTASDVSFFLANGTFANGSGIGFDTTNAGGTFTAPVLTTTPSIAVLNLTKLGTGTLVLPNPSAFGTGATTIFNGTVNITSGTSNSLGTGALVLGTNAGVPGNLDLGSTSQTVTTVTARSNSATPNIITIGAGQTLTATGAVTIGVDTGATSTTALTVTGATGTFSIGTAGTATNANVLLGLNATTNVSNGTTVDLSGVGTFFANLGTGTFRVGDATNSGGTGTAGSTLILAPTSTIKATTITSDSPDGTFTQAIKLGSISNILNANTVEIGGSTGGRSLGTLNFITTGGTLTLRNLAGSGRATLNVGYGATATGFGITSTVDLTGHNADLLLSTLSIAGRTGSTGGVSSGTFLFDNGTIDATGITVGNRAGTATTAIGAVTGTLTLGGGTVTVGASGITVATNTSTISPGTNNAVGTVTVSGATVTVGGAITLGSATTAAELATATLNITGGSLTLSGAGAIVKGTTTGTVTSTLTLNGASAVLDLGGKNIGTAAAPIDTLNFVAGTLRAVNLINGTAGVTKTGTATDKLILAGTNAYTGATAVNAGTMEINGTINATSSVSLASGTTLLLSGGSERVANVPVSVTSATLKFADNGNGGFKETLGSLTAAGTSVLDHGTGTTNGNAFDFTSLSAATASALNAGTIALNVWNWNAGIGGGIDDGTNNGVVGDAQDRLLFDTVTGLTATGLSQISFYSGSGSGFLGTGNEITFGSGYEVVPVPEPSSMAMLGTVALLGAVRRRKRRHGA